MTYIHFKVLIVFFIVVLALPWIWIGCKKESSPQFTQDIFIIGHGGGGLL